MLDDSVERPPRVRSRLKHGLRPEVESAEAHNRASSRACRCCRGTLRTRARWRHCESSAQNLPPQLVPELLSPGPLPGKPVHGIFRGSGLVLTTGEASR
jgi:hypothetical protein